MHKHNSPLMQVWERECPEQWGQQRGRVPAGTPQLSAPPQTPHTRGEKQGVAGLSPPPRHRHPQQQLLGSACAGAEKKSSGSSPRSPSRSSAGMGS